MMAGCYAENPRLLPTSLTEQHQLPVKYERVPNGSGGHYAQWVEACIAGHGKKEVSSPFSIAGPLTEALLMANLAIRGSDLRIDHKYPRTNLKFTLDNANINIPN